MPDRILAALYGPRPRSLVVAAGLCLIMGSATVLVAVAIRLLIILA